MEDYRVRRQQLAALAEAWRPGQPVPEPSYTAAEHDVWRRVWRALAAEHDRHACGLFRIGKEELRLPADHLPQLTEVTASLEPVAGFRYLPVAGLAPLREFYESFADGVFWSTQYVRSPEAPFYTPEPDVIHEVIGHANQLASPGFADVYRVVGEAARRVRSEQGLAVLSRVFWFTMEFGVVWEGGEPKAYGAGILSSVGETQSFGRADIRPADLGEMASVAYDISSYQPRLYAFGSMDEALDVVGAFFAGLDDDRAARLVPA